MKFSLSLKVWLLAFVYTLLSGLLIQRVVLVYFFPQWNSGAGLLSGLDGEYYHQLSLALYQAMLRSGWGAWELFPRHQFVSGVSALFYYLIAPQPWSVLPLHALLNACACVALLRLLTLISRDERLSALAVLPFLFFPSALQWNAQLNNDVYSAPGIIFFITGWAAIFAAPEAGLRQILESLAGLIAGFFLTYLVRPYLGLPLAAISALLFLAYLFRLLWGLRQRQIDTALVKRLLVLALIVVGLVPFVSRGVRLLARQAPENHRCDDQSGQSRLKPWCDWQASTWLPGVIDQQFRDLSISRAVNLRAWREGASTVDADVVLISSQEVVSYLPRAFQIGLLAPFPGLWGGQGSQPSNTLMRRVAAVEMLIVYLSLVGWLPGFFLWKRRPAFYVTLLIGAAFVLLLGLVIPNVGTLYRFRYPFLMSLVSIGLVSWLALLQRVRAGPIERR
jgi:hypothetical protein